MRTTTMSSRRIVLLAVAVLVLLAGCTDGTGPAAPSGGTGGSGGDAGAGDGASGGGGDGGSTDGFTAADREQALRDAGSYTTTWGYSGTGPDGERGGLSVTQAVDLENQRALTSHNATTGEAWQQFYAGETTYYRYQSGDEDIYTVSPGEIDLLTTSLTSRGLYDATGGDGLVDQGQETYDGVPVTRYELADSASLPWTAAVAAGAGGADPDSLRAVDWTYTLLVDGDGLIRYESWGWTGTTNDDRTVSYVYEYSITGVGTTTVEDPEWLAAAEESSR